MAEGRADGCVSETMQDSLLMNISKDIDILLEDDFIDSKFTVYFKRMKKELMNDIKEYVRSDSFMDVLIDRFKRQNHRSEKINTSTPEHLIKNHKNSVDIELENDVPNETFEQTFEYENVFNGSSGNASVVGMNLEEQLLNVRNNENLKYQESVKEYKKSHVSKVPLQKRLEKLANYNHEQWETVNRSNNKIKTKNYDSITLSNAYEPLPIEEHLNIITDDAPERNYAPHQVRKHNDKTLKRPNICTTENYLSKQEVIRIVPGNRSYASTTKLGEKNIFMVGDSHLKHIKRNVFNKSITNGKSYFKSFSGANAKQLEHYVLPTLVDEKPDIIIIHIGSNDVNQSNYTNVNPMNLAQSIIAIGNKCKYYGVKEVVISSILIKRNVEISKVIHQVNKALKELCKHNHFYFICNDAITRDFLWRDGIHLMDAGTNLLAGNFVDYLNGLLLNVDYVNNDNL